jgi:iron complex outermembrane receptor protein
MHFKKTLLAASLMTLAPAASFALEEVVVTATKRSTSLQDTSMSITAITAKDIVRSGATDFTDLATSIPSLSLRTAGPGRTKLNIRGISAATGVAPTVSFYLDEMPIQTISSGSSTSFQQAIISPKLYDLERMEVLRGPQGTLYGSSSMGGTVRLITAKPLVGEEEGSINLDLSDTKEGGVNYVANAMYNVATGDSGALRVVASYTDREGFHDRVNRTTGASYDDNVNNEDTSAVRVTYRYEFENTYVQPSVFYQKQEMDGKPNYDGPNDEFEQRREFDAAEPYDDEFTMLNLTVGHSFESMDLLASVSNIDREVDNTEDITDAFNGIGAPGFGNAQEAVVAVENAKLDDTTVEIRLSSSNNESLHWMIGGFYKDSEADAGYRMERGFPAEINPYGLANTQDRRAYEEVAIFSEVTYDFGERFSVTLGGRYLDYTYEQNKEDWGWAFANGDDPDPGARMFANNLSQSVSDDDVHAKLTGTWHLDEGSQLYATVSNGSRPGGFNRTVPRSTDPANSVAFACDRDLNALGLTTSTDAFDGDEVTNYEFGWKAELGESLRFNGAIYLLEWDDIQQVITLSGECGVDLTANLGEAESKGAELEMLAAVTDNFTVSIGASYTDAELLDDVPTAGVSEGDKLTDVPEWTANITLDYTLPGEEGDWFGIASYNYVDETLEFIGEADDDVSGNGVISGNAKPDYGILDMRIGFSSKANWEWVVYVDNVTDEEAIFSYSDALAFNLPVYDRTVRNRPRTIGTSFTYNF